MNADKPASDCQGRRMTPCVCNLCAGCNKEPCVCKPLAHKGRLSWTGPEYGEVWECDEDCPLSHEDDHAYYGFHYGNDE